MKLSDNPNGHVYDFAMYFGDDSKVEGVNFV